MQISIDAKALADELYKLLGVTSSKGPLTIVSNALLTANEDNTLTLEATDLEVTVSTRFPCDVAKPGQLCLQAHNLFSVVKGLKNQRVDIQGEENQWARLTSGDVNCRMVGVPPVEFPRLPALGDLKYFSFETDHLLQMIERTIFSVSTDEGRPNLIGASLRINDDVARMTATDGHRLCTSSRSFGSAKRVPEEFAEGIIIPRKSLAELKRTVGGDTPSIEVALSGNNAVFRFGETTIMVRLVDATFPDYSRVVPPQNADRQARVDCKEFTEKLKFVALFSNPRTCNVSVQLDGDLLQLSASDPDKGEGSETMPATYIGPKVQVGFNYRYLLDVMGVLEEPQFRFQILDAYSASLILDGDREDDLFLVMPMRL